MNEISNRWIQELRRSAGGGGDGLPEEVAHLLVSFLPACFGEWRERGLEAWHHGTHLYGSLALRRGLAAGEVVEELHLLRGVILRLYLLEFLPMVSTKDPDKAGSHMEFLGLDKILDQGVSRASVSYVDDLFFSHLQGSGVADGISEEMEQEVLTQLRSFRAELGC